MRNPIRFHRATVLIAAVTLLSTMRATAGANDPISGVGIGLGKKPNPSANTIRVTTDSLGNFTLRNLSPGEYLLTISQDDFRRLSISTQGVKLNVTASETMNAVDMTKAFAGILITVTARGTVSGNLYRAQLTARPVTTLPRSGQAAATPATTIPRGVQLAAPPATALPSGTFVPRDK